MSIIFQNKQVAPAVWDMEIEDAALRDSALPGQFLHIKCGEQFLRRPISICDKTATGLRILYQTKGEGTKWLAQQLPGTELDVLGPLGNGFELDARKKTLFVGGGIGLFPLLYAARKIGKNGKTLLGAANREALTLLSEFESVCEGIAVATDDGSGGEKGFVTALLERELLQGGWDMICACGPEGMLQAVQALSARYNVPCQLSAEARMSCGVGACLGCAIRAKKPDGSETYLHVCKDGPVFPGNQLIFD